jgi:hypothetical protein
VITGVAHRRRFSTDLKLAVVAETIQPGMSISYVAAPMGSRDEPEDPADDGEARLHIHLPQGDRQSASTFGIGS